MDELENIAMYVLLSWILGQVLKALAAVYLIWTSERDKTINEGEHVLVRRSTILTKIRPERGIWANIWKPVVVGGGLIYFISGKIPKF